MPDVADINFLTGKFIIGLLLFIRLMGMFIAGPFFRSNAILPQTKVFLAVIMAASLASAGWQQQPLIEFDIYALLFIVLKEFFVGALIGFSANMVFYAARFAGGLLDFEIGYQTGLMFSSEDLPTLLGELKEMIVLMLFLFINGHHFLIESIYMSVKAIPITTFEFTEPAYLVLIRMATSVLILGMKMAAPVLVALFMTNLGLVLLARVAPQTNIFILSFQLKVVVGLLVLLASIPLFVMAAKYSLDTMERETLTLLKLLNP
jgi:flagellar biosynthetic protein FliR